MSFDSRQVVVSCEHASNRLPDGMEAPQALLDLHIAWDPGAVIVARHLAALFDVPLHAGKYSRLVADLNRTLGNSRLIRTASDGHKIPFNRRLDEAEVQRRIEEYYLPYRKGVADNVAEIVDRRGRCVHLCIHTFTPKLRDKVRGNDVGLLYDPYRQPEAALVHELREVMVARSGLVVWLNRPYSGLADGILPRMRESHSQEHFIGIELEVNQKFTGQPGELRSIAEAFGGCLSDLEGWDS